ncbi:type VI secretion protein VasK [Klebsiella pneumoniae]|uniref:Type VI secretion protein VasK n=1 Tax=Klebsiella pneumoniae TaxID=573 RepID=A0A378G4U0_KLEPN|nr:type VI secretion protein VasK [Klebsiella pneumoniae]
MRLRLQQVTNATDPQAMTRCLRSGIPGQGRGLTETRDYGSLVAAGWASMEWIWANAFVRPMEQAWQQV